jgi:hypothetical protein
MQHQAVAAQLCRLRFTLFGRIALVLLIGSALYLQSARAVARQVAQSPQAYEACNDSLRSAFKSDGVTTVRSIRLFKRGDDIGLDGKKSGMIALVDLCVVKVNVGPGNPGPTDAPSTSSGIGIEVWLPPPTEWNQRLHVLGGGGFAGDPRVSTLDSIGGDRAVAIANNEHSVSAVTDAGHVSANDPRMAAGDGSFGINPDGTINKVLWTDFASRGIHEMAVVSKQLATAYYGHSPKFSYWDGCSTGGRQGLKEAQEHPEDFDGILVGAPAINWTTFITGELYPQIVVQRDLGGVPLTADQLKLASSNAVSACDKDLNGEHAGYITDPSTCRYDPTKDQTVLCKDSGGSNTTSACLSLIQATAMNKIWYGQTSDGSVPSPATDNGFHSTLATKQLWFGVARGTVLNSPLPGSGSLADSDHGKPAPFRISIDQVVMDLQKISLATPAFHNAAGTGSDGWIALSYKDLALARDQGIKLQSAFGNINTDNPDLSAFASKHGKIVSYHGLADPLIPIEGTINYYSRVVAKMGGLEQVQSFFRFYEIPGLGHCFGVGSVDGCFGVSPSADPPLPAPGQLFQVLQSWVEQGTIPENITVSNAKGSIKRPLCVFPKKVVYVGGDRALAESYSCR